MMPSEIKKIPATNKIGPNKLMGQNFLVDHNILKKIISAANIRSTDTILEIGPGKGMLTFALAARASKVIAIEKDPFLVGHLKQEIEKNMISNIELKEGDILKMPWEPFARIVPYRVVANIPYYLTSRLLRMLLTNENPPEGILVTIQKEVAERIAAKPPKMNLLSLSVQMYAAPKILFQIPKSAFFPLPSVESALISIENISRDKFIKDHIDEKFFFDTARAAFQAKRKMLAGTLARHWKMEKSDVLKMFRDAGISESARPQELSGLDWLSIITSITPKLPVL